MLIVDVARNPDIMAQLETLFTTYTGLEINPQSKSLETDHRGGP